MSTITIGSIRDLRVRLNNATDVYLKIRVKIADAKQKFGRQYYLVEPVSGEGKAWVEDVRLT